MKSLPTLVLILCLGCGACRTSSRNLTSEAIATQQVQNAESRVSQLVLRYSRATERIDEYRPLVRDAEREAATFEERIRLARAEATAGNQALAVATQSLADARTATAAAEEEQAALLAKREETATTKAAAEKEVAEFEAAITAARQSLADGKAEQAALEAERQILEADLMRLQDRVLLLTSQAPELRRELEQIEQRIRSLRGSD
jgi:chromosome segregation ATPase